MGLYRRLLHAIDNYGLRALTPPPPPTPGSAYTPDAPHPFDLTHGVDTSGYLPGESLATGSPADLYNTAYYAISPSTLTQALAACPIAPAEYTFIDLGCGKGRALLVAAQLGFAHIIGVEISSEVASIARRNLARNSLIEIETGDAASFRYPSGVALVIFLYHPFLAPALHHTLQNLCAQNPHAPVPSYILFANPSYDRILTRRRELSHLWTRSFFLSAEDAAADRHGLTEERYSLYEVNEAT